ncbi:nucleotide-binding domain-containing protein [Lentithecium fluviatile CBS 122367]|uniref:Nucleotide-binding domain-containing protein n=1 Tax=Lentithecium fluviatile CBS 122367 TaxID=1168545 RepID=A0A6G1J833_9PLEO|nr:nucleotide-binding domain-containing protein [Lentithecium fluviatile CBS 122367]
MFFMVVTVYLGIRRSDCVIPMLVAFFTRVGVEVADTYPIALANTKYDRTSIHPSIHLSAPPRSSHLIHHPPIFLSAHRPAVVAIKAPMAHILIIGAGVIGLQTANTLLDAGYKVTILAKHWPGDEDIGYTSPWAGAIWRTHASPDKDLEQCEWNIQSYNHWISIVDTAPEEAEQMGIRRVPLTIYSNSPHPTPRPWYTPHVQQFSILSRSSPMPNPANSAHTFSSIAINPSTYLTALLTRAKHRGAKTIKAELPTSHGLSSAISTALRLVHSCDIPRSPGRTEGNGEEEEVLEEDEKGEGAEEGVGDEEVHVVVNCTGLAAKRLCGDENVHPIRGQTLLVRITPAPSTPRILLHDTSPVTYIVPRLHPRPPNHSSTTRTDPNTDPTTDTTTVTGTDTYLLGGTNDKDNWSCTPDATVTADILGRCGELMGKGGLVGRDEGRDKDGGGDGKVGIEVLREMAGLRPGRKGGVRVEGEDVVVEGKGMGKREVVVVHQYGHAGAGYQNSVGSAGKVLRIVREALGKCKGRVDG